MHKNFNWNLVETALVTLPNQIDNGDFIKMNDNEKSSEKNNNNRKCKLIEHCQKSANNKLILRSIRIVNEN